MFSDMKDVRELRDLILLLAPRNGNMIDISKIASSLGISRMKVYTYLEFLQGIFFLKLVSKYTGSIDKSVAAGKKVYFSDSGLLNLIARVLTISPNVLKESAERLVDTGIPIHTSSSPVYFWKSRPRAERSILKTEVPVSELSFLNEAVASGAISKYSLKPYPVGSLLLG